MGESRNKPGVAFLAAMLLVIAVAAYVGAYVWMVEPVPVSFSSHGPVERMDPDYTGTTLFKEGTRDQEFWDRTFIPVHWMDRRIRRETWTPQPVSQAQVEEWTRRLDEWAKSREKGGT